MQENIATIQRGWAKVSWPSGLEHWDLLSFCRPLSLLLASQSSRGTAAVDGDSHYQTL